MGDMKAKGRAPAHSAQPRAAPRRHRRPSASEARTAKVAASAANDAPRARGQASKRYKGLCKDWLNRRPEPGFRLRKAARQLVLTLNPSCDVAKCERKTPLYLSEIYKKIARKPLIRKALEDAT